MNYINGYSQINSNLFNIDIRDIRCKYMNSLCQLDSLQISGNDIKSKIDHCSDFLNKIQISLEDLTLTKELGYSQGMAQIFLNRLKGLERFERPIHCTDVKRRQFYIRENENWNLDNGETVVKAIDMISTKQLIHLSKIKDNSLTEKGEEFMNLTNKINDK